MEIWGRVWLGGSGLCLSVLVVVAMSLMSVSTVVTGEKKGGTQGTKINLEEMGITATECRKMMLLVAKKQMKVFVACSKEVHAQFPDKDEFKKRFQCVIRCALFREKMLDENMAITNETLAKFFEDQVPPQYLKVGHIVMDGCIAEWGPKLDPKEETCSTYGKLVTCMQSFVGDMCVDPTTNSS